jgi:hypothetical protein
VNFIRRGSGGISVIVVCLGVAAALVLGARVEPLGAASSPSRLVGVTSIGGLAIGSSYAETVRHFGGAGARAHFDSAGCTLGYPKLGVSLSWVGDPLADGTSKSCVHFEEAAAVGSGWHTRNGLFVGDSTRKLRRLFPHVYDTRHAGPKWNTPTDSIEWDITITCCGGGARPALSAMVARGRIVAFVVEMVGH